MSKEKNTPAITEDMTQQIEKWKKEHGDVFRLKVKDPQDPEKIYVCYVKKPSKKTMAVVAPFLKDNPVKAGDILRENCFLSGDPEINAIEECQMGVNLKMFELFKIAETEEEKL